MKVSNISNTYKIEGFPRAFAFDASDPDSNDNYDELITDNDPTGGRLLGLTESSASKQTLSGPLRRRRLLHRPKEVRLVGRAHRAL